MYVFMLIIEPRSTYTGELLNSSIIVIGVKELLNLFCYWELL